LIEAEPDEGRPIPGGLKNWSISKRYESEAHLVNRIRAEKEGLPGQVAVARPESQASAARNNDHIMEPERFAFHQVRAPGITDVLKPAGYDRQEYLLTPHERLQILRFDRDSRMAKEYLDKEKHAKMRCVALMQKRFPSGVDNCESSAIDVSFQDMRIMCRADNLISGVPTRIPDLGSNSSFRRAPSCMQQTGTRSRRRRMLDEKPQKKRQTGSCETTEATFI